MLAKACPACTEQRRSELASVPGGAILLLRKHFEQRGCYEYGNHARDAYG